MSCECNTLIVGESGPQGPQGLTGISGTNGTNGVNAYSTTTAAFVQPTVGASVGISVDNNSWIGQGQILYIASTGYYQVTGLAGLTGITATLIQTDGIASGASAGSGRKVSPSGNVASSASIPTITVTGTSTFERGINANTTGGDYDSSIQGENDTNLVFVDASADRVGIGTNAPSSKLEVSGTFRATGSSDLRGAVTVNQGQSSTGDFTVLGQTSPNLIFADASTNRVGIGTSTPGALLDVSGAINTATAIVNPSLSTGDVFTVRGGNSTYRIHVVNSAVGIGTSTPSTIGAGATDTNMSVNGVLNAIKLAVGSGTVSCGITRVNYGVFTVPAGGFPVNANSVASQDVSVLGASQGDFVLVGVSGLNTTTVIQATTINAQVKTSGVVEVCLKNHTATGYSLAAGTTIQVLAIGAQLLP